MSGSVTVHTVEVTTRDMDGLPDARGDSVASMLATDHGIKVGGVRVNLRYLIKAEMSEDEIERTVYDLFADPVIEIGSCTGALLDSNDLFPHPPEAVIQVGFKPGGDRQRRPGWSRRTPHPISKAGKAVPGCNK